MAHELQQQVAYIRAALEQEKKPLGFLIGAGAPMSMRSNGAPLIPGLPVCQGELRPGVQSKSA